MTQSLAVPFEVEAPAQAREAVDADLSSHGLGDDHRRAVLTVLTELVMNALVHGDPTGSGDGAVEVAWAVDADGTVTLAVTDGGTHGFPHLESPEEGDAGGRGLRLVDALSSSWSAERSDAGTTVSAVVPAPG